MSRWILVEELGFTRLTTEFVCMLADWSTSSLTRSWIVMIANLLTENVRQHCNAGFSGRDLYANENDVLLLQMNAIRLFLFRIGDLQIRNKNGEQLESGEAEKTWTSQWLSQRSISGCNAPRQWYQSFQTVQWSLCTSWRQRSWHWIFEFSAKPSSKKKSDAHKTSAWLNALYTKKALDVRGQKFDIQSQQS